MNIAGVAIGLGQPCRTVAELSNNHNGDLDIALALIGAAKEAGADLIKIQCFTVNELVALRGDGPAPEPWGSQGYTMATLYEQAQTPLEWLPRLFREARRFEIPMFSSVFGRTSLAALEAVGCPAYKISHFEYQNWDLKCWVHATGKPWMMSLPHADREMVRPPGAIYCPGGYPAAPSDMKLSELAAPDISPGASRVMPWMGLSSHCKDPLVAPVAVARGAKLLEYHFMLSWRPSKLEQNVSLTEIEFRAMVDSVRQTEVLLG